jgi:hypothetical protein
MEPKTRERIRERQRGSESTESEKNEKSGSKKGLIIAFIIFMLAVNGVLIFLNFNKSAQIEEKEVTIVDQKKEIDTKSRELKEAIAELEVKKMELAQYGADTTRLHDELESVKERLRTQQNFQGSYYKIKKELENLKALASQTELELSKYKAQVDTLQMVNKELESKLNSSETFVSELKTSKDELAKKFEIASVLKAENVQTFTLSAKGKEKEGGDYKSKDIDLLRVSFILAENRVAKAEGKEIILRVIEPDGGALFDLGSGGGSFIFEGKEIFYTQKQDVIYDNKSQQITFDYKKGSPYKPGEHKVEIYSEGHKIGETTFNVR